MTRPLTADEIVAAMKAWGIPYVEEPGWRSRSNGTTWSDPFGFLWHHTGDDAPDTADLRVVTQGHAGLSGPLCNFGLADDGTVHLVSVGPANHAGGSDPRVIAAVENQSYDQAPPAPRYIHGEPGSVVINRRVYGVESFYYAENNPAQFAMMPKLAAAIIWAMNKANGTKWNAKHAFGHKESQRGKIDPRTFAGNTMATLRAKTQQYLDAGPGVSAQAKDWFDMATKDDLKAVVREVLKEDGLVDSRAIFGDKNPAVAPVSALAFVMQWALQARDRIAPVVAKQAALEAKVDGVLAAVAKQGGVSDADLAKITAAAQSGAESGVQAVLDGDVKVDVSLTGKATQ